jgi:hypothetical protein
MHQVRGAGVARHGGLYRACAVGRGNAGRYPGGGFDRDGERGAVARAVALGHRRKLQTLAMLARQGQADQPAAMLGHEVDRRGRDMIGGDHQVTLVLAILVVDEDHHAACGQLGNQLGNGGNRHW